MTTPAQAIEAAALVAFFAHDDRNSVVDPITTPDVECTTDEAADITYPPFGGTR